MKWLWKQAWLIAPITLFIILTGWYSLTIPLGEGPDEPGHAGYAFWLARTGRLPNVSAGEVVGEGHQPPLAYWLYQPLALLAPADQRTVQLRSNPHWSWNGGTEVAAFGRRSLDRWPFHDDALAWHAMRGVSIVWGILTLLIIAWAGQRLGLRRESIGVALGLIAVWPQVLFHFALVSNDSLLWLLCSLVLALLVDPAPPRWWGLSCGAALGAALLVKQSAILLIPLVGLGWWLLRPLLERPWRQLLELGGATVVVAGWWYGRNVALYGDVFGLNTYQQSFISVPFDPRDGAAWSGGLSALGASLVGRFGWMNLDAPWWVWVGGGGCVGLGCVGLGCVGLGWGAGGRGAARSAGGRGAARSAGGWGAARSAGGRGAARSALTVVAMPLLALGWTVAFAVLSGQVAWQGRFVFPALAALALGLGVGLTRFPRWVYCIFLVWVLIGSVWIPWKMLPVAYATPTIAAQPSLPIIARWKPDHTPAFELRALELSAVQLHVGESFTITTRWQATGSQDRDWSQFWHLAHANEEIEAVSINVQPSFLASRWTRGDWWNDALIFVVPKDLPLGNYELRLGWFDEFGTGERVGIRDNDGVLKGDYAVIAIISVVR